MLGESGKVKENVIQDIIESWWNTEGNVNTTEEILSWVNNLNQTTEVEIVEKSILNDDFWFYDDYNGEVLNKKRSFFSIKGVRYFVNDNFLEEQPIIVQPEIGYLGIIAKKINGVLNFLMQAKIEPGNINCVQISPTIQATKSNFTRAHGGKLPAYFKYFEQSYKYDVIYDQIQSEQSSRFLKKRNRNMIMIINQDIDVLENYKWMTLGQIKKLMEVDNLVNMDTRTVISGLPLVTMGLESIQKKNLEKYFIEESFFKSIFEADYQKLVPAVFQKINNYKMFNEVNIVTIPLNHLVDWNINEYGIECKKQFDFMVKYYDINISGREVQHWSQPLFKAIGMATFGLLVKEINGVKNFLVSLKSEVGCFDKIELGSTIQWSSVNNLTINSDCVQSLFMDKLKNKQNIVYDVILSEEGGRFFHEQNRNVIIELDELELTDIPDNYIWVDYGTLNYMIQFNNCLNIQLRNLLSLLKLRN